MGETFKFTNQNVKEGTNNKAITNGSTDGQIWGRIAIMGFENLFPNSFSKFIFFVCYVSAWEEHSFETKLSVFV